MVEQLGERRWAPILPIAASALLVTIKAAGAWATGSLALGSAALDSLIDCFIYTASFLAPLGAAQRLPIPNHAFGHGKYEDLAMLGQGLFLLGAAASLVMVGIERLESLTVPRQTLLGRAVLAASLHVGLLVTPPRERAPRQTGGLTLKADSERTSAPISGSTVRPWSPWPWCAGPVGRPSIPWWRCSSPAMFSGTAPAWWPKPWGACPTTLCRRPSCGASPRW